MDLVEADISSAGGRILIIETASSMDATQRFHSALGYLEQGRIAEYFAPGEAKVIFARPVRLP
ncbi:MAG: hypothetical protein MK180_13330 [Rhodobacteraceae bacterium]|nr:hypothetical protein [Paracoccaceae bacterium]